MIKIIGQDDLLLDFVQKHSCILFAMFPWQLKESAYRQIAAVGKRGKKDC